MNFLLEGLQDVSDEDEKNTTLELINKLKVRLEGINKQIENSNLSGQDNDKQVEDSDNQAVEEHEAYEEIQSQHINEQDDYENEEVAKESYTDEDNTQETYNEEESEEEDTESPKVYVGRKDNGNILGYYHKVKKQGK